MKTVRLIFSALAAALIMALISVTGYCASGINSAEQDVLDKLDECAFITASNNSLKQSYINGLRNYFNWDDVDLTAEQAAAADSSIQRLNEIALSNKKTLDTYEWESISDGLKNSLIYATKDVCLSLNLKYSYDSTQDIFVLSDKDGKIIFSQNYKDIIIEAGESENIQNIGYVLLAAVFSAAAVSAVIIYIKKDRAVLKKDEYNR